MIGIRVTPRRLMVFASAAVVLAACSPEPAPTAESPVTPETLERRLHEELDALDALSALYAKHLPTGREVAIRADRPMNTLSTIKVAIMIHAFREAEAGRLDLDERHTIRPEELRRGSGLLKSFQMGLPATWRDLVTQMIITSDNTATDAVLARLGRDRVNAFLRSAGYEQTTVRSAVGDLFKEIWVQEDAKYASLTDREVYQMGFPANPETPTRLFALEGDSSRWFGRTTAREMSRLIEQLYQDELTNAAHATEMVDILRNQFYTSRLPRFVQYEGVSVAHKTGDWPPHGANDVGLLFYEGGPVVISVYTGQGKTPFDEMEQAIGRIAQLVTQAWGTGRTVAGREGMPRDQWDAGGERDGDDDR